MAENKNMKKTYQILIIGAIILLGGAAFFLTYEKVIKSWKENKEIRNQEALSVDLETDINKRASYIIAQKKSSLLRHYDENSELVWFEEGAEKAYRGTKEIQTFWDEFFRGASIASSDSSNFQMAGNRSQIDLTLVIWRNGSRTTLKKFYRLELGETGKIRKEIFSDQGEELAISGGESEKETRNIYQIGILKAIDFENGKASLEFISGDGKNLIKEFSIAGDFKVVDGEDSSKEMGKEALVLENKVAIEIDTSNERIKNFIIEK